MQDLSLLHLQCHIGTDTVSWARLGAVDVAGIDLSPNSLRHADRIAKADGRSIEWVEGDVRFASTLIDRRFDIVVTSAGTIVWLRDLDSWARSIHDLLKPGGVFMIRDDHPIVATMDNGPWEITGDTADPLDLRARRAPSRLAPAGCNPAAHIGLQLR